MNSVNALNRAYSISTERMQVHEGKECKSVNALNRAYSISTTLQKSL